MIVIEESNLLSSFSAALLLNLFMNHSGFLDKKEQLATS